MSRRWRRYAPPSSGVRISGSETISMRGTEQRLRSESDVCAPAKAPAWTSLPASSSRWMRVIPIPRGPRHPRAEGAGVVVGGRPELRRTGAEDLAPGRELGVHLEADDRFELHPLSSRKRRQPRQRDLPLDRGGRSEERLLLELPSQKLRPQPEDGGRHAARQGGPRE